MKKSAFCLSILFFAFSLNSCKNSKSPGNDISVKNQSNQNNKKIEIKDYTYNFFDHDNSNDSVGIYTPDERDLNNTFKGFFDIPELFVAPSNEAFDSIGLSASEKIIDFDASPAGLIVAVLTSDSSNNKNLKFWKIGQSKFFGDIKFADGFVPKAIKWHPDANSLFVIATLEEKYHILRLEKSGDGWKSESIFSTDMKLDRLVICPRPFIINYDSKIKKEIFSYRIFFGIQKADSSFRIASITEYGKKFYQVIGPSSTFSHARDYDEDPSKMEADWALPASFHPSGEELIWNDSKGNFFVARYWSKLWGKYDPFFKGTINGGVLTPTPNGLGLIHWQKEKSGLGLLLLASKNEEQILSNRMFETSPSFVADGKGIVGLTKVNNSYYLNYIPLKFPQSDVVNAWMYSETLPDIDLFSKNFGLFRPLVNDQLYQLYESENYNCNNYDESQPTRPYLVTTDIFWELFGSAFQGIFTIKERTQAIPSFWSFIDAGNTYLKNSKNSSPWAPVFEALFDIQRKNSQNPETNRILNSQTLAYSEVIKKNFDYSQLEPRGFYTSTTQMQEYFKAFKYLTTVYEKDKTNIDQLNSFPSEIKMKALEWIESYKGFISSPRRPNVFDSGKFDLQNYIQYADTGLSVFPLSWGFDNEVLNSTVYHIGFPKDKQIISTKGEPRLLPSGLDLASALSNDFASTLLEEEYLKYPNLRNVIRDLRKNFVLNGENKSNNNLYDKWITALSEQWTDTVHSTNGESGNNIWQVKRLQTGLASWATLRHATVLVNERSAAECGEGGFETILLRAPRGYVEPDPYTFHALSDMFETAITFVPGKTSTDHDINNIDDDVYKSLYDGITMRLADAAKKIRLFEKMAEKEKRGETLSNDEYDEILHIGRIAEHYFLIFKSLANEEYALSTPDPMLKVTDVFGSPKTDYLMAAVGRPLEWDFTVPFYGRHQVVKGCVYSYYEFYSGKLLNDKEWINISKSQTLLPWIKPFVSEQDLSHPPRSGY